MDHYDLIATEIFLLYLVFLVYNKKIIDDYVFYNLHVDLHRFFAINDILFAIMSFVDSKYRILLNGILIFCIFERPYRFYIILAFISNYTWLYRHDYLSIINMCWKRNIFRMMFVILIMNLDVERGLILV